MNIQQRSIFLCVVLFSLAGCSAIGLESKRIDYKTAAIQTVPLEVPPDLTAPSSTGQFIIPNNGSNGSIENGTHFSQFSKETAAQTAVALPVLPVVKNMHIERSGMQRWLVVNDKAEKLWPSVKEFWQENGFTLLVDNAAAGVMETDFVENRGIIPSDGVRKTLGKIFSRLYSSGEKDMFRTRFERDTDGHTEIYISHRGLIEQQNADGNGFQWRSRGNDREAEAAMLQMLAAKLGGYAPNQSSDSSSVKTAPISPALAAAIVEKQVVSTAKWVDSKDGSKAILLQETFDKSWRKVGLALEQAGIEVHDKDRANGVYFLSTIKNTPQKKSWLENLAFWRDSDQPAAELTSVRYQVTVRANNLGSEISVVDQENRTDATTQRIIDSLFQQLSK